MTSDVLLMINERPMAERRYLTLKQRDRKVRPYATELGVLTYNWNGLQDSFSNFLWIVSGRSNVQVTSAIWYAIQSDKMQRAILRAAVKAADDRVFVNCTKARADILWLLKRADILADQRNIAIHTAYFLSDEETGARLVPIDWKGNRRAKKLTGKDLLREFKLYGKCARLLWTFSFDVQLSLISEGDPSDISETWPDRPELPNAQDQLPMNDVPGTPD
jgi:hypothetical protein